MVDGMKGHECPNCGDWCLCAEGEQDVLACIHPVYICEDWEDGDESDEPDEED